MYRVWGEIVESVDRFEVLDQFENDYGECIGIVSTAVADRAFKGAEMRGVLFSLFAFVS